MADSATPSSRRISLVSASLIVALVLAGCASSGMGADGVRDTTRDTMSDTWVAVDDLGRVTPSRAEIPPPRKDRFVGMFYFLWLGAHGQQGPFDIAKILAANPNAMNEPDNPAWGPPGHYHHWGEPLFGYYLSDDRWVIRKHAQMLADAGVDVVIFDCSNAVTYKESYIPLLEVFAEVRRDGGRTPQVAFLCPFGDPNNISAKTCEKVYDDLYGPGLFSDLWFRWEGKPLILALPDNVRPEVREFFTFRRPEPSYFVGPRQPNMWSWLQNFPQHVFHSNTDEKEQMAVGVGQNAWKNERLCAMSEGEEVHGRSRHGGATDTRPDAVRYGLNFAEQWDRALSVDPKFLFVTGWNEWIAMRLSEFNKVKKPVMFVDQFSQEYSRDIEPMKGGHGDDYYYQFVDYVRRYKGARTPPPAGPPRTIRIDGDFSDWGDVAPVYLDDLGDTMNRDHEGWGEAGPYADRTGRNDFDAMKVARDETFLYFYARTREPLSPATDPNWMLLFIDADRNPVTGWRGFDFVANRKVGSENTATGTTTSLEKAVSGWDWKSAGVVQFRTKGNELELAIPRGTLGVSGAAGPVDILFKWADNTAGNGDPMEFLLHGDTAPNGRFCYVYREARE